MSTENIRQRNSRSSATRGGKSLTNLSTRAKSAITVSRYQVSNYNDTLNSQETVVKERPPIGNKLKTWMKANRMSLMIACVTFLLFLPIIITAAFFKETTAGGVTVISLFFWLESVWISLWFARILAKGLPFIIEFAARIFQDDSSPWKESGKRLNSSTTLLIWCLMSQASFRLFCQPASAIVDAEPPQTVKTSTEPPMVFTWRNQAHRIMWSIGCGLLFNFVTKIILVFFAVKFHMVNYKGRIDQINEKLSYLITLYEFSLQKILNPDSDFEFFSDGSESISTTSPSFRKRTQKNIKIILSRAADAANAAVRDLRGRETSQNAKRVKKLLKSVRGCKTLGRRLFWTYCPIGKDVISAKDIEDAFESQRLADAAFSMLDKAHFGDISEEQMEAICIEYQEDRKSIYASIGDMNAITDVLEKAVFWTTFGLWLVLLPSSFTSSRHILMTIGTVVLSCSWMFIATVQETFQCCMFVFVKHPYDVGDRVHIYGNTGENLRGEDYFVKEIGLWSTVFKRMEGHVIQAPNTILNTLFILNQNRSSLLAEGIPLTFKFTTTWIQIDTLRRKMLDMVTGDKRQFDPKIYIELLSIVENHELHLKIYFFFSTNYQNDALRLQRRNKFMNALAIAIEQVGIEGPRWRYPGLKPTWPVYTSVVPPNLQETPAVIPNPQFIYPTSMTDDGYGHQRNVTTDISTSDSSSTESPPVTYPRLSVDAMESGLAGF